MSEFKTTDLQIAVKKLATMKYFPHDSAAAVMDELRRMCPSRESLEWLISEAVSHFPDWIGLAELRGLLCSRYDAADGVERYCGLPGYTAEENYQRYLERHEQLKLAGIAELPEGTRKLLQSAARGKGLPRPKPEEAAAGKGATR